MSFLGIVAGVVVFGATDALVGHVMNNGQSGILPGIAGGIWAAWPLFHLESAQRELFLHPAPRIYNANVEDAFATVRDVLRETTYNFGDGWRVTTSDNSLMRIVANLTFQEEEMHVEMAARGELRDRKEYVKRYIKLECQMKNQDGRVIIQFDFFPKAEGFNTTACDGIIAGVLSAVDRSLAGGQPLNQYKLRALSAPPWWILGFTALTLVFLAADAFRALTQ
jgi:hypothetical protein